MNLNRARIWGIILTVIGAVLAIPALVLILQAVVTVLSNFMWDWVAMLLVGVVIALVGYLLVRKGQNNLSAGKLAPERTAANLRRDVRLVQEKVS